MPSKYRWKGKYVSETIYKRNLKLSAIGSRERKTASKPNLASAPEEKNADSDTENQIEEIMPNFEEESIQSSSVEQAVEGCRIVDLGWLAKSMDCQFCNEYLSLKKIEKEVRLGFGSFLHIRCHSCLFLNKVSTGKQHQSPQSNRPIFDINTKFVLGALHAGLGHAHVNKLMHTINIPAMPSTLFKRREREIGSIVEELALKSCQKAAVEERNLTIQNVDVLQKLLPANLRRGFIIPDTSDPCSNDAERRFLDDEEMATTSLKRKSNEDDESLKSPKRLRIADAQSNEIQSAAVSSDDIVRVFVSYDMGWSRRGTGRSYDSLNGYAAIIGTQSGKVLDYTTRNRKCRLCDVGHEKNDHDCRLNFFGTAKAMEADAAVQLATASKVLKNANLEVGVFIGDNDSPSICSVRKASDHQIVKQDDMNHTSKGVSTLLFKMDKSKDPSRELTAEVVQYLHRCFVFAAAQHTEDGAAKAAAIRNVPFHAFNHHENCGDWCGYWMDKENYDHNTVPGGLKSAILFEELKSVFGKLADNSHKFVAGASSQANESLNAGMTRKAPKAICYSTSESADFRFAAAVCQKNEGEGYVKEVLNLSALQNSPRKHLVRHIENCDRISERKSEKSKTKEFKLRRRGLQKSRIELRKKKANVEGKTYESNMELLGSELPETAQNSIQRFDMIAEAHPIDCETIEKAVIFFDIETSGFSMSADILQIALKSGSVSFERYINPTQPVASKASEIHGLTNEYGDLHLRGVRVESLPKRIVLGQLLQFLQAFKKPCTLVAHNCSFDASRLLKIITEVSLVEEFRSVIAGFSDTLALFRKKFPARKSKGELTLTSLATKTLSETSDGAHNASYDAFLLEKLSLFHFTLDELTASCKTFDQTLESQKQAESSKIILTTLQPLEKVVSRSMRVKMAKAGITYGILETTYRTKGEEAATMLLMHKINGKAEVIKSKKILGNILDHLKETNIAIFNK